MVGLHTTAAFYYYPGFHEPGLAISLGVNARLWDSLTAEDQSLITLATAAQNSRIFASTQAAHIRDLGILLEQHGAKLRKFDDDILRVFGKLSGEVVAELGASDPFTRRVYDSYMKFRKASQRWLDISDRAYLNARSLGFNYGG